MTRSRQQALEGWLERAEQTPRRWLLAFAALLAVQIGPLWYAAPDGAAYLSIARSIAGGGPIARLGDPQLGYPLGYPLLISPAFLAGAQPYLLLSIANWGMAIAFMLGVYVWMRRRVGPGALWLTGLVLANVGVWTIYRRTLSETAFLALLPWTIVVLDRAAGVAGRAPTRLQTLGAVSLVVLLSAIREVGVLFGVGFALLLALRVARGATAPRVGAPALALTAAALLLAVLSVRPERIAAAGPALAGNLAGYADAGAAVVGSFGQRAYLRMSEVGQLLVPGMFKAYGRSWRDINTLVYAPLLLAVVAGWWRLLRRRADVFCITAPLYAAVLLAWPYLAGTRYVLPLLPLLVACVWVHLEPYRRWRLTLVAVAMLAHLGVALGQWLIRDRPAAVACAAAAADIAPLADRIGAAGASVSARQIDACVALRLALTLDRPVRPAVADDTTGWLLTPRDAAPPSHLVPVATTRHFALFRPPGSAGGPPAQ